MNPSSPTFLSKPSIHDQLRNMSAKLNNNTPIEGGEVIALKNTTNRYLVKEATPKTVKIEMEKVVTSADDFLHTLNSEEEYPDVSAHSVKDIDNALNFYDKRQESTPLRRNIAKVGSEMRPRSRQMEEDLKSLKEKNQKTEEGEVLALEAKVRLMREVRDSENIIEKNRSEIKRLRWELSASSFDKNSLQEKLDQAGKDLEVYEEEILKVRGALDEAEENNKLEEKDTDTPQATASKPIRVEGGLAGLANVNINIVNHVGVTPGDTKNKIQKPEKELKPEIKPEIKKGLEDEVIEIPKSVNSVGYISGQEAEEIRNKIVSDLKVKLLEFKSVEELDHYVALEQDKLRDLARERNIGTENASTFYRDMTQGRIKNMEGRVGASFDFLVNRKKEELIKENKIQKKSAEEKKLDTKIEDKEESKTRPGQKKEINTTELKQIVDRMVSITHPNTLHVNLSNKLKNWKHDFIDSGLLAKIRKENKIELDEEYVKICEEEFSALIRLEELEAKDFLLSENFRAHPRRNNLLLIIKALAGYSELNRDGTKYVPSVTRGYLDSLLSEIKRLENPASKIEAEVEQAPTPTPTIPDVPVIGVSAEDTASISKPKSPRITKPKIEANVWGSTVRGLEDSGLRNQINSERDEREDTLKQESEKLLSDERLKLDEKINMLRTSFEAEMNRKNEEVRRKEEELIRLQAELGAEKNKNQAVRAPINQSAPKAPEVTDVSPKIQPINLDEIIEKLKLKKDPKPVTNNVNTAPAAPSPTYVRPNTKRLEEKTGKVGLRSAILTAVFAGLMAAGGGYVYGEKIGTEKTTETVTANFNAQKIKDAEAATKKAEEVVISAYNKGYEKSKIDAAENLLTKEVAPEIKAAEPAKVEEKTTTKPEQKTEATKAETKLETKSQEPAKKLEWTNKASVSPRSEAQSLNTAPVKSSVDFSSLAGADNKSVEVKRTEKGTVYKLADYGVEGANKDGIEYIANPIQKSVERRNNFCNLRSVESKAFLGFNSLQDAATACLHQLWRYQSGNNKVGLSGDSTLEQMIGKYANLSKVVNEDGYENYLKIIQKTYKDYGVKVNQDTKLASLDMSKMLEAISVVENRYYAFDAKSMTVNLKPGVSKEMLTSAGNIMNNGPESEADNYAINNYGQAKYHFAYNPFIIKTA